jgi:probable HAF family extracellular repeat protein
MSHTRIMKTPFVLLILLLGVATPKHAVGEGVKPKAKVRYDIQAIPFPRGTIFQPCKLNARGEVLGSTYTPINEGLPPSHMVIYRNGKTEELNIHLPRELESYEQYLRPRDLNNRGDVLFSIGVGEHDRCFLLRDGTLIDLNAAVGPTFEFRALNDVGQLVGTTVENKIYTQAFIYSNGQIQMLGFLDGYPNSAALALNNTGKIVGWAGDDADPDLLRYVPVTFEPSGVVRLDHLAYPELPRRVNDAGDMLTGKYLRLANGELVSLYYEELMMGMGMNNDGVVAGSSYVTIGPSMQAVLYDHGVLNYLNETVDPLHGWFLAEAEDINDSGQIFGMGMLHGEYRAFLMSPRK